MLKSGTTEHTSGLVTLATGYIAVRGDQDLTENPDTSAPWTANDLDAIQVGVKMR